jgi:hypothetical protein
VRVRRSRDAGLRRGKGRISSQTHRGVGQCDQSRDDEVDDWEEGRQGRARAARRPVVDHGGDALVQTKATVSSDFGVAKTGSNASREEGERRRTSPGSWRTH